jgi:hypothetical protein
MTFRQLQEILRRAFILYTEASSSSCHLSGSKGNVPSTYFPFKKNARDYTDNCFCGENLFEPESAEINFQIVITLFHFSFTIVQSKEFSFKVWKDLLLWLCDQWKSAFFLFQIIIISSDGYSASCLPHSSFNLLTSY